MTNRPDIAPKKRDQLVSLAVLGFFLILFYASGHALISAHYQSHPAHYDSVGAYYVGFLILDSVSTNGFMDALSSIAPQHIALSPLQTYFAWLLSPILSKSEASFHLYNTLWLGWAFGAIVLFGHRIGMRPQFAALLCLFILLPDALYWWQLGVFDYRRDPACLFLLTGSFFLMLGYFTGPGSGKYRQACGILLGLSTGLTLLSRDTAFGFVFGVIVIPSAFFLIRTLLSDGWRTALQDLVWPLMGGILPAAIWVGSLPKMLDRIMDPFMFNGAGINPFLSFIANLPQPLMVWAFPFATENNTPWVLTLLLAILGAGIFFLWRRGDVMRRELAIPNSDIYQIIAVSVWAGVYVHLFLSFIVKWNIAANMGPLVSMAPYYYSMVAGYGIIAAGLLFLHIRGTEFFVNAGLVVCAVLILGAGILRAEGREWPFLPWKMEAYNYTAELPGRDGKPAMIAELWREPVMLAVNVAARKKHLPEVNRMFFEYNGVTMDTFVGAPKEEEEAVKAAMKEAVFCTADFIIMTTDIAHYQKPSQILLFRDGRGMIEDIMKKLKKVPRRLFAPQGTEFVPNGNEDNAPILIVDNRERLGCHR